MKALLFFSIFFVSSIAFGQKIRLRANFYETNTGNIKTQDESDKLLVLDLDNLNLTIYGNPSERFDFYESFNIDENTTMFPSLDENGDEFALEIYLGEDYVYVTIQFPEENELGSFDNRMYVCSVIE